MTVKTYAEDFKSDVEEQTQRVCAQNLCRNRNLQNVGFLQTVSGFLKNHADITWFHSSTRLEPHKHMKERREAKPEL